MTEQEAKEKSADKIKQIQEFAQSLDVKIEAQQVLVNGNVLKTVVYYIDQEDYPIDPPAPAVIRGPEDASQKMGLKSNETPAIPQ